VLRFFFHQSTHISLRTARSREAAKDGLDLHGTLLLLSFRCTISPLSTRLLQKALFAHRGGATRAAHVRINSSTLDSSVKHESE
jgi:hypothetical protein